jgi:Na+-driven multidrug efflux pump
MAAVYLVLLVPRIRAAGVALRPHPAGVLGTGRVGSWLMLRTLSLRVGILATVWVATDLGAPTLAAHQLVFTLFTFMAFALDALAIAAQALIGKELGAGNAATARAMTRLMTRWGMLFGVATGVVLAVAAPHIGALFTSNPGVQQAAAVGIWVLAASQPLCGLVFVLDGVLIGAGDAPYLAVAGIVSLVLYAPLLWAVIALPLPDASPVLWLWCAFGLGYMLFRALTLLWRVRNDDWMSLDAPATASAAPRAGEGRGHLPVAD